MAQKRSMESRERKILQDRGALPQEKGDVIREYEAMHGEHFPRSWLSKGGEDSPKSALLFVRRIKER